MTTTKFTIIIIIIILTQFFFRKFKKQFDTQETCAQTEESLTEFRTENF